MTQSVVVADKECEWCEKPIAWKPTGRPRKFCSDYCRKTEFQNRGLMAQLAGESYAAV